MTETHEVVRKTHWRSSSQNDSEDVEAGMSGMTKFEPGDLIEPTEAELRAFPDRFRELTTTESQALNNGNAETESAGSESEDEGDSGNGESPLELSEMTVAEIQEALSTGDYDDRLDELEEYENQNDGRKGVRQAIDERR